MKILIIDDDEHFLRAIRYALASEGFDVLSTATGPAGIQIYTRQRPAVVLLDLGLPAIDGIEVLTELRALDPNAKVLIVTGYAAESFYQEAMAKGAVGFLQKPVDEAVLIETIMKAAHRD